MLVWRLPLLMVASGVRFLSKGENMIWVDFLFSSCRVVSILRLGVCVHTHLLFYVSYVSAVDNFIVIIASLGSV